MDNKAIARFMDGRVVKGVTADFSPGKDVFHIRKVDGPDGCPPVTIRVKDLKLLAFVYNFDGDPNGRSRGTPRRVHQADGRVVKVTFADGEVLMGTSATYQPGRPGFFVEPTADTANEERIYVLSESTRDVVIL